MLQLQWRLSGADVPELDGEVARGGGEDVLSRRIEEDLTDLPMRLSDFFIDAHDVLVFLRVPYECHTLSVPSAYSRAQHLLAPRRR